MKNRKNLICNIIIICLLVMLVIPVSKIITTNSIATDENTTKTEDKKNLDLNIAIKENLNKLGDIDANGLVDSYDALIILQYINFKASEYDMSKYDYAIKYLDSNKDGKITVIDAGLILTYTVSGVTETKSFEEFVNSFDEIYTITEDGKITKK